MGRAGEPGAEAPAHKVAVVEDSRCAEGWAGRGNGRRAGVGLAGDSPGPREGKPHSSQRCSAQAWAGRGHRAE